MGILGTLNGSLIEGTLFEGNNVKGSAFHHAIYLSGGSNNILRNNRFIRNAVVNGVCSGGNVTVHGLVDGLTIEGNLIEQSAATGGCYGFSITPGHNYAEAFRNVVVRGNTVVNVGGCAVCAGSAPGIVVEGNKLINTQATYQVGVLIPAIRPEADDAVDTGAVVRNNTICQSVPASGSAAVRISAGAETGNVYRTGPDATTGVCTR
jgi:parallel beta-helix repeat protein